MSLVGRSSCACFSPFAHTTYLGCWINLQSQNNRGSVRISLFFSHSDAVVGRWSWICRQFCSLRTSRDPGSFSFVVLPFPGSLPSSTYLKLAFQHPWKKKKRVEAKWLHFKMFKKLHPSCLHPVSCYLGQSYGHGYVELMLFYALFSWAGDLYYKNIEGMRGYWRDM